MKRTVIIAFLAALALAGCSKENKDDQQEPEEPEIVVDQEYCETFFSGEFLGTRTDMAGDSSGIYDATSYEDIIFTPYATSKEVTGISSFTADGEAVIVDWCVSESTSHAFDPITFTCYYSITYDDPITMYFCEYDPETGLTTDSGVDVPSTILDEISFKMMAYWRGRRGNYFTYTRQ